MPSKESAVDDKVVDGSKAPDFKLKSDDGKTYSLSDFKGQKQVVLYFYPKDDTPGCTIEACSFRDSLASLNKAGVQVLGVSMDDLDSHGKFRAKYSLNFPLLADTEGKVSKEYGVYKLKKMYGNEFWGIERSTFIIGKDGKVKKAMRKVNPDGHVDEVRKYL
ncbi:MAG: thioredoxin-dependent thiol peroxidase [Nitrososphaerales archaeon]